MTRGPQGGDNEATRGRAKNQKITVHLILNITDLRSQTVNIQKDAVVNVKNNKCKFNGYQSERSL